MDVEEPVIHQMEKMSGRERFTVISVDRKPPEFLFIDSYKPCWKHIRHVEENALDLHVDCMWDGKVTLPVMINTPFSL